jgi:hypothetical protein
VTERLLTTVVGSYPQPEWLVDRQNLQSRLPPRIRARDIWRIPEPLLQQAQDDATPLAIRDMERAGIDILTDGEIRRESYSNCFATALVCRAGAPDAGAGLRYEIPATGSRLWQALCVGRRSQDGSTGIVRMRIGPPKILPGGWFTSWSGTASCPLCWRNWRG